MAIVEEANPEHHAKTLESRDPWTDSKSSPPALGCNNSVWYDVFNDARPLLDLREGWVPRHFTQFEFYVSRDFPECWRSTRNYARWIWMQQKKKKLISK